MSNEGVPHKLESNDLVGMLTLPITCLRHMVFRAPDSTECNARAFSSGDFGLLVSRNFDFAANAGIFAASDV